MSRASGRSPPASASSTSRLAGRSATVVAQAVSTTVRFLPGTADAVPEPSPHAAVPRAAGTSRGCNLRSMPRTAPSGADAALISALAEMGLRVSQAQLERWRAFHYLLRHPRRGLGRGRGTASVLVPRTVARAAWLAAASRQGRRLPVVVEWAFWSADGTPGGLARLRSAVLEVLDCYGRRLAIGMGSDDAGWQERHDAVRARIEL
jgi:hypothetical protein